MSSSTSAAPPLAAASAALTPGNANDWRLLPPFVIQQPGPLGMTMKRITDPRVHGGFSTVVGYVKPGSVAALHGLRVGDVPVMMGYPMAYQYFIAMCGGARPLVFHVARDVSRDAKLAAAEVATKQSAVPSTAAPPILPKAPTDAATKSLCNGIVADNAFAPKNENVPNESDAVLATKSNVKANAINVGGEKADGAARVSLSPPRPSIPSAAEFPILLAMTKVQLQVEMEKRNIKCKKSAGKDEMLEKLGIPATQWNAWRKMKVAELKVVLKGRGEKLSGTKHELLTRLGVPEGFGETSSETSTRKFNEHQRARKKQKKEREHIMQKATATLAVAVVAAAAAASRNKKSYSLDPTEDPNHEAYEEKCCDHPEFNCSNTKPAGSMWLSDGSMMEAWRCVSCGKIPHRPNAPYGIDEYSSDDEGDEAEYYGNNRNGDCIIQ